MALVNVLAARRHAGSSVVLVSSGAIAAGLGAARAGATPAGPRDPAGRGERRAGRPRRRIPARLRRPRPHCRPGAAHRRRRDPAYPLLQRAPNPRTAPRARRRPRHQRERHGGDARDPVRRQRPARRAGRSSDPRRRPRPPVRRRRAVRRTSTPPGEPPDPRGRRCGGPRRGRGEGVGVERRHRRDGDEARGRGHRDRGRCDDPAHLGGPRSRGPCGGGLRHPVHPDRLAARLAAALARACDGTARARPSGRRCRSGGRGPTEVVAAGGDHRGRGAVRRGRSHRCLSARTAIRSPAAWSTTRRTSCPACSAARPTTSPASSGPQYEREVIHRDDMVLLGP